MNRNHRPESSWVEKRPLHSNDPSPTKLPLLGSASRLCGPAVGVGLTFHPLCPAKPSICLAFTRRAKFLPSNTMLMKTVWGRIISLVFFLTKKRVYELVPSQRKTALLLPDTVHVEVPLCWKKRGKNPTMKGVKKEHRRGAPHVSSLGSAPTTKSQPGPFLQLRT